MHIHVIMPVGADPNYREKKQIIENCSSHSEVAFHFPDYCQIKPEFNLKSTLKDLESACLVLADLSQERPSCYYELGLAQAIGKKIYIVATEGTPIHQACGREHVHYYRNLTDLGALISGFIETQIKENEAIGIGAPEQPTRLHSSW